MERNINKEILFNKKIMNNFDEDEIFINSINEKNVFDKDMSNKIIEKLSGSYKYSDEDKIININNNKSFDTNTSPSPRVSRPHVATSAPKPEQASGIRVDEDGNEYLPTTVIETTD